MSTPPQPEPDSTEDEPSAGGGASVMAGWPRAVVGAGATALGAVIPGIGLSVIALAASGSDASPLTGARLAGALFLSFHRVMIEPVAAAAPGQRLSLTLTLLGGLGMVLVGLARAGRWVGDATGGSAVARGTHGSKVGLAYAALVAAVSMAVGSVDLDAGSGVPGGLHVRPSIVWAFVWPLLLGAGAGFVGGFRSAGPARRGTSRTVYVRSALSGGWVAFLVGLALSFGGLLILAAVKPSIARFYGDVAFGEGTGRGVVVIGLTLLALPNLSAWVLLPAMGSCIQIASERAGQCSVSYWSFPVDAPSILGGQGLGPAPRSYLLFLTVPLLAVLLGGMVAARRSRFTTRRGAILVGATSGVVFATLCLVVAFLSAVVWGSGAEGTARVTLGPPVVRSTLVALAWGVVGGAFGGWVQGPDRPPVAGD